MEITLREIANDNWIECISLRSKEDNKNKIFEDFTPSNAFSLAQSSMEGTWITKGIYVEETMVGFAMYGLDAHRNVYEISRLMIDYKYQKKGYAKEALKLIIEDMEKTLLCNEIYTGFNPDNEGAAGLYKDFCFEFTGAFIDDELVYRMYIN